MVDRGRRGGGPPCPRRRRCAAVSARRRAGLGAPAGGVTGPAGQRRQTTARSGRRPRGSRSPSRRRRTRSAAAVSSSWRRWAATAATSIDRVGVVEPGQHRGRVDGVLPVEGDQHASAESMPWRRVQLVGEGRPLAGPVGQAVVVPAGPGPAVGGQQAGVGVQRGPVGLVADGAEHLPLARATGPTSSSSAWSLWVATTTWSKSLGPCRQRGSRPRRLARDLGDRGAETQPAPAASGARMRPT